MVKARLVAESPINMECKLVQVIQLGGPPRSPRFNTMVIGEVIVFHIADEFWTGQAIDVPKLRVIGRLGSTVGHPYCKTTVPFELKGFEGTY